MIEKQRDLARQFQNMHKQNKMFVLPNVWNAASAVIFQKEGFKAVATTSAGVAYSLGYKDGEDIDITDLGLIVEQITRRISIPLSVDFERGYSEKLDDIKQNAKHLLNCGAVGFNIEDGKADNSLDDIDFMVSKIRALVDLKKEVDIDFVINARTCTYWLDVADDENKKQIAINRCNAYRKAGANCVFIPGAMNKDTIKALVDNINAPINIILNPNYHDIEGLSNIGVSRLSVGSGPVRSTYSHLINMAKDLADNNTDIILNNKFSYKDANEYFER